jgi:hypothetical protein
MRVPATGKLGLIRPHFSQRRRCPRPGPTALSFHGLGKAAGGVLKSAERKLLGSSNPLPSATYVVFASPTIV